MCLRAFVIAIRRNAKPGRSFVGRPFFLTPDYKTTTTLHGNHGNRLSKSPVFPEVASTSQNPSQRFTVWTLKSLRPCSIMSPAGDSSAACLIARCEFHPLGFLNHGILLIIIGPF